MAGVVLDRPTQEGKTQQHTDRKLSGGGKIFITRHGERADLADEQWLAQADVSITETHSCASQRPPNSQLSLSQVVDDPPLTQQGLQQAHELGVRLQVG